MIQILFILLIWSIIIGGTKFINYSSKFFFLQKNLSFYDKINYFNIDYVTNFILKLDVRIQKIIIYYLLLPILKINYIFLAVITSTLFKFNQTYFDDIIKKQDILYANSQKLDGDHSDISNVEDVTDTNNYYNNDENDDKNDDNNNYNNNNNNNQNENNNIFDSIRMIKSGSKENSSSNDLRSFQILNEIHDNYDKNIVDQALDDNKTVGLLLNNELNLFEKNKNIINQNNEIFRINEADELDENNINNYLINNNISSQNRLPIGVQQSISNEIVNDEIIETIRIDEIDFGNIVNNIIINEKKEEKVNSMISDKKVNSTIRIGKKKI
jgi:hypothetical protein